MILLTFGHFLSKHRVQWILTCHKNYHMHIDVKGEQIKGVDQQHCRGGQYKHVEGTLKCGGKDFSEHRGLVEIFLSDG